MKNANNCQRVEQALKAAGAQGATINQLLEQLRGLSRKQIKIALTHLRVNQRSHFVANGQGNTYTHFWGAAPRINAYAAPTERFIPTGNYVPKPWSHETARPQGDHHKRHGSLQADGTVKPYRAPMHQCIGSIDKPRI